MSREATAPIPYASPEVDAQSPTRLAAPLPMTLAELARFASGDDHFPPPHWVRLRAAHDPSVGARYLASLRALAPLVSPVDATAEAHMKELTLDSKRPAVARFAADALASEPPSPAADRLFAMASHGRGPDFDRLFARADVPLSAHLLRLSALRDYGGMTWSEAFATRVRAGLSSLGRDSAAWTLRLIAELTDPAARRFLQSLAPSLADPALARDLARFLAHAPTPDPIEVDDDHMPTDVHDLELLILDQRKPERRVRALGALADVDWNKARRIASSIATDEWRLDETIGALLNHPTRDTMIKDFAERGLIADATLPPPVHLPSARELLRQHGRVLRFDTTSIDGIVDHDHLAYLLAGLVPEAFEGVDFLEEIGPDQSCTLHAYADGRHYRLDLDTSRSVIDPYGLVGLCNVVARDRGRPERLLLAAEDKAVADVVGAPEAELRSLVDAGLLWIRSSFRW